MSLRGKKLILGVTGSIASYKSCQLLRRLKGKGAEVKVVMTKNATKFISPLTFQTLSENPVYVEMFYPIDPLEGKNLNGLKRRVSPNVSRENRLVHIKLTEWADVVLIAPATANIIAKTACGIADDLISTILTSFQGPIIFAPAMDEGMYNNAIFRENVNKLKEKGYHLIPAVKGALASGKVGEGRFPPVEEIMGYVSKVLLAKRDFAGKKILITAGGTREYLDPVRFIGNASSGKMGYALAEVAKSRGAEVKLISAPTLFPQPEGIEVVNVTTARQMKDKVKENFASTDILIMAGAVGDFRPGKLEKHKRKRAKGEWNIQLLPNPDILLEVSKVKKGRITVGFSIEIENQINKAKEKLKKKNLDLIVANDIKGKDSGFGSDTNKATFIDRNDNVEGLPLLSKEELSNRILDKIKKLGVKKWKK